MHNSVLIVLLFACSLRAQFQFPLLSQFVPSHSPLAPSGRVLFPPPPPTPQHQSQAQLALVPRQPHGLNTGLTAPPPPQELFNPSPKLEEGPLRVLEAFSSGADRQQGFRGIGILQARELDEEVPLARNVVPQPKEVLSLKRGAVSDESTLTPFVASPTTIRFTLEDVPDVLETSLSATHSNLNSDEPSVEVESLSILENPLDYDSEVDDDETNVLTGYQTADSQQHLFILTSTENSPEFSTLRPSAPDVTTGSSSIRVQPPLTNSPILQESESSFRPSFSFPFLEQSTEVPLNLFTVVETRNPRVSSFLRSEAPHFLDSKPKVFALTPIRVKPESIIKEDKIQETKDHVSLHKTPVPKPVYFSNEEEREEEKDEEKEDSVETVTKADKPIPTRKTFHFEQEFLSLLKKNNQAVKSRSPSSISPSEPMPFWFSEQNEDRKEGIWRLKGGVRAPSLDLLPEDSVVSQITLPNSLGGLFATSIRGLSPVTSQSEESLKILDDLDGIVAAEGISVKSLAQEGLSRDPVKTEITTVTPLLSLRQNVSEATLKLRNIFTKSTTPAGDIPHGPLIVPVGEVGEVPHEQDSVTVSPVPALSAALKHGVQNLNVTAWVSGCPKLYGKVELNCAIEHDAISNTAMTLMWKKKSFTEGRPQEHIMTENDLLKMEDSRFSVHHQHNRYVLSIKDFRPKDCGTYECEAKAADTRASSQLLLFTCL